MTLDLFLHGVPPRQRSAALYRQLQGAIADGRLAAGDRLPTTRSLAEELGLARSTVTSVYARLVAEGHAQGRVGDGTFVAPTTATVYAAAPMPAPFAHADRYEANSAPGLEPPPGGWVADLRSGRPDPGLFPLTDWRRAVGNTLHRPPPGYGDAAGLPELRRTIAAWVKRSRGVDATEDHVLITAGAQGAFDLCAHALVGTGGAVAVESPGYRPARSAFAARGARIIAVPVDRDGIVVDQIPIDASVIVVTPSHQAPTGALLSPDRRRELLERAAELDAIVIEDDYDTEYRYVDRPLEPLHRLDTSGRTVYVGSFSKTISPSLRIGFLVAPPAVVAALADARTVVDAQPPHLTQAALAAFITSGAFERHLRRTRRVYRDRRDLLVARLTSMADDGAISAFAPCHAGLHTTVTPPVGIDADDLARRLRASGIAVTTTADDQLDDGPSDLVIGFGLADSQRLEVALDVISSTIGARR